MNKPTKHKAPPHKNSPPAKQTRRERTSEASERHTPPRLPAATEPCSRIRVFSERSGRSGAGGVPVKSKADLRRALVDAGWEDDDAIEAEVNSIACKMWQVECLKMSRKAGRIAITAFNTLSIIDQLMTTAGDDVFFKLVEVQEALISIEYESERIHDVAR